MRVTGIIMECNPFHEGHDYLLKEARRITQADYIIVVMSGDYVQRGEPAVFDKYIRADQVLKAGADLVLELPLYMACGSAEYFARGGIFQLEKLGVVTDLCFGSETGDLDHLAQCARILSLAEDTEGPVSPFQEIYQEKLRSALSSGLPFPAARTQALEGILPSAPNDLLGVEYCRALSACRSAVRPHAIRRIDVPSATQHRQELLKNREALSGLFPDLTKTDQAETPSAFSLPSAWLQTGSSDVPVFPIGPDDFSPALLYALCMNSAGLDQFADVSQSLADRISNLLPQFCGFSDFTGLLKTRNLTRTRVSRCLLHILLQLQKERLQALVSGGYALYARPLAMNRQASPLFTAIRGNASIPFLSKLSRAESLLSPAAYSFLQEEIRAEDLYVHTLADVCRRYGAGLYRIPKAQQRRLVFL
ncbi:MAG: nucleotidyltransferase family protein [Sarcina sp.]|nr:nucleotidyltransferase family protein [Sarcina sp.]